MGAYRNENKSREKKKENIVQNSNKKLESSKAKDISQKVKELESKLAMIRQIAESSESAETRMKLIEEVLNIASSMAN